jgi:hypothetical protein
MTTVSPSDSSIRFTDTIKTQAVRPTNGAQETDWSAWENWLAARLDQRCKEFGEEIGEAIGDMTGPLEKRIKTLELELAQTRGAVDILRGRGAPGTFNLKGNYDPRTSYAYLDVVVRDSSSFVARRDNPGSCPGDDWQMIACGGKRGATGEKGERGPAGPAPVLVGAKFSHRGMEIETGSGDAIPLFKSVAVNPADFSLRFTASDNSTLTISLLPLFQSFHAQTAGR